MVPVRSGDVVAGKYRVEHTLGSGGMGHVVAAVARFRREARAAVRLKSQHVAKVHDVGVHDGDEPFIVMEYLEGADLRALAGERGPLAAAEASDYVLQACEALAEAHALGIVLPMAITLPAPRPAPPPTTSARPRGKAPAGKAPAASSSARLIPGDRK
ncbi:MAG: hypothetical protein KF819_08975 [Labilithrix sp.]|nr:hypothetical protein [Labilithrix sp.]